MRRILCKDSVEGIFTGVYYVYQQKYERSGIELKVSGNNENYQLFTIDEFIEPDMDWSVKVAKTVQKKFGMECYYSLLRVAFSTAEDKAEVIFRTIEYGLEQAKTGKHTWNLLNNIKVSSIARVFEINRNVKNEASRYVEFIRFQELANGILFSEIEPENYVLPLVAEHFADRLKKEHFLIYDVTRSHALVHPKQGAWEIYTNVSIDKEKLQWAEREAEIQQLWKQFFTTIAIEDRKNIELQTGLLPLKFRKYMTEFM